MPEAGCPRPGRGRTWGYSPPPVAGRRGPRHLESKLLGPNGLWPPVGAGIRAVRPVLGGKLGTDALSGRGSR